MKFSRLMWNRIKIGWILLLLISIHHASAVEWMTNAPAALARARQEKKSVLFVFTGSDWCKWTTKLKADILDSSEFEAFAGKHLILVNVDFPLNKPLPEEQRAANEQLAQTNQIFYCPALLLLDENGKKIGRSGYTGMPASRFIADMAQTIDAAHQTPSVYVPLPPSLKFNYRELTLRDITSTGPGRVAIITDQIFSPRKTWPVQMYGRKINVRCREINDDSAVVEVEGMPKPIDLHLHKGIDVVVPPANKK